MDKIKVAEVSSRFDATIGATAFPFERTLMADSGRLDELKRKFDENPRRYFAPLANEYRKAGDTDRAIELCRTYLPQQPTHMSGYIVYGQALFDAGRHDESAAVFRQALTLDTENVIALRYLGDIARAEGDSAGAMRWYGKVLDLDPRNEEITASITALATPSARTAPKHERVAPPTVRPEPEYDSSSVALGDLLSQPDAPQPGIARSVSTPEQHTREPEPEAVPLVVIEQSFEIISWPKQAEPSASVAANATETGNSLDQSADFTPEQAHDPSVEAEALSFADFLPDERTPPAPDDDVFHEVTPDFAGGASSAGVPSSDMLDDTVMESPFVTETMAELYLQQGLPDDALVIYRQLVIRRDDPRLHLRIAELEGRTNVEGREEHASSEASSLSATVPEPSAPEPSAPEPAAPAQVAPEPVAPSGELNGSGDSGDESVSPSSSETVREFFARIGAAKAKSHPHIAAENERRLGGIFSPQDVDASDLSAAQSLAGAFGAGWANDAHA